MRIESAVFENYRNIAAAELSFSPGVNILWGQNAQGKSNLLEGMYYFARGKSFRGVPDRLLVRAGTDFSALTLRVRGEGDHFPTELGMTLPTAGRKRLTRAGAPLAMREMLGSFRAVLFCPDHLSLVSGSPAERRSFLDIAIAQISPGYLGALTGYDRALKNRNALLKQAAEGERVEVEEWESLAEVLSRLGVYLAQVRTLYVARMETHMQACFREMTGGRETPEIAYSVVTPGVSLARTFTGRMFSQPLDKTAQAIYYNALLSNLAAETRVGTTLYGIHRDDATILLNGESARLYASQGQTRSLSLAMKLAEGAISREITGEEPVYLLDDVFSELDGERREYLLSSLGNRQVIITSCEPEIGGRALSDAAVFHVENGAVTRA